MTENSEIVKIIDEPDYHYWGLSISLENNTLTFSSNRDGFPSAIYVSDLDGNNIKRISSGNGYDLNPSFSPDGTKIIFSSDESSTGWENLYIMNLDGSEKMQLTNDYSCSSPSWKQN